MRKYLKIVLSAMERTGHILHDRFRIVRLLGKGMERLLCA
jgi:hypothetical protein